MANEKYPQTNAALLGRYRRELEDEGFDLSTIQTLVIEASRALLRDEPALYVSGEVRH